MEHGGLVIYYMKLEKGNFALPPLDEKGKIHPFSWQKLMLMVQVLPEIRNAVKMEISVQ
jgi:transposase